MSKEQKNYGNVNEDFEKQESSEIDVNNCGFSNIENENAEAKDNCIAEDKSEFFATKNDDTSNFFEEKENENDYNQGANLSNTEQAFINRNSENSEELSANCGNQKEEKTTAEECFEGCNETKSIKKLFDKKVTKNITKLAILTALSFVLYAFAKFPIPSIFPAFLDIQVSDIGGLLAGFSMGPVAGAIVIILKCLLKMPLSSTGCVGELGDIVIGLAFVLPASIYYKYNKNKKGAFVGLILGSAICCVVSVLANWLFLAPFYMQLFGKQAVIGLMTSLFPKINEHNFYAYYLPCSILPFNLLRCIIVSILTFLLYKRLSKILHW